MRIMSEGLILVHNCTQFEELKDLFPTLSVVPADSLDMITFYDQKQILCVVCDIDNKINIETIAFYSRAKNIKFIFIKNSRCKQVGEYLKYGCIVKSNGNELQNKIIEIYRGQNNVVTSGYIPNATNRSITLDGVEYKLRNTAYLILMYLLDNVNIPCSRKNIITNVYNQINSGINDHIRKMPKERAVDVQVHYLRKVLNDKRIKTVPNGGYVFKDK